MRELAKQSVPLAEMRDVRNLHRLLSCSGRVLDIAGRYADQGRYVLTETGRHISASPAEMPALMGDFARSLASAPVTPQAAVPDAHRLLVDIPVRLDDGNGRTARLLMNLMLIRGGYPPDYAVRPEDRPAYVSALQQACKRAREQRLSTFFFIGRLDATLRGSI